MNQNSNSLAHHGILGMKWGIQNGPPYPLDESDHSQSEKKAGWRKSLFGGSSEEKAKRKVEKEEKQKVKAAKQEAKWEKKKEKILQTGNVKKAKKYADKLSNDEIRAVIDRYNTKKMLSDFNADIKNQGKAFIQNQTLNNQQQAPKQPQQSNQQPKQKTSFADKLSDASTKADKIRGSAEKIVNTYNTGAKIVNAVNSIKGNPKRLPVLDMKPKEKKSDTTNTTKVYNNGKLTSETVKTNRADGNTETIQKQYTDEGKAYVARMLSEEEYRERYMRG